jgi:hypothetical protein
MLDESVETHKAMLKECWTDKDVELTSYIFKKKVPSTKQMTFRNDSLVISNIGYVEFDEALKPYTKDPCSKSENDLYKSFLIDIKNGKVKCELINYSPMYNRSKFAAAIYSTDTNKIITKCAKLTIVTLYEDYKGYKINLERRNFKYDRYGLGCSKGDRIAIYKNNKKLINYRIKFGLGDYILHKEYLFLLSERGRGDYKLLTKLSLNQLIGDVKKLSN